MFCEVFYWFGGGFIFLFLFVGICCPGLLFGGGKGVGFVLF